MYIKKPYTRPRPPRRLCAAFAAVLLALVPLSAHADPGVQLVTSGGTAYQLFSGGAAAGTLIVIDKVPGRLYRIINANGTAQTAVFTCYDSSVGAIGTVLYSAALGASQIVDVEEPETTGLTCTVTGAALVAGPGVLVTWN
jgi:hypothetical protein